MKTAKHQLHRKKKNDVKRKIEPFSLLLWLRLELVFRLRAKELAAPPSCLGLRRSLVFQGKEAGTRECPLSKSPNTRDKAFFHPQDANIWHLPAASTTKVSPLL